MNLAEEEWRKTVTLHPGASNGTGRTEVLPHLRQPPRPCLPRTGLAERPCYCISAAGRDLETK